MIFFRNTTGFEVAGSDLCLAVIRSRMGKLRLHAVHRIPGFLEMDGEARRKAVKTLAATVRIPKSRVFLGLPREQGIVRQVDLPADLGRKFADIVRLQVETLSPWPLEEIYWDFAREPQKKDRKLAAVTIAIIPRSILDPWIAFFKDAGIPLSGATLSSLAIGHGAGVLWKDAVPTVVLRQERSYAEGVLIHRTRIAAITGPPAQDAAASTAFLERLLAVGRMPSAEGARLIACGSGLDASLTTDNPRIPMEDVKPESALDFGAIATALVPLQESAFRANLVPAVLRYNESRLNLIPSLVLAVLAICAVAALAVREPYQSMAYASRIDDEIARIAPQVREVADQESELNKLLARYRALAAQLQARDANLDALRELARVVPSTTFLSSYGYQDGVVTISGFAASASEIQSLLENSPLFKGVELTTSVTRDAGGKDRFTLRMTVEELP
jgi:Tfp pilus assembly protein PilN